MDKEKTNKTLSGIGWVVSVLFALMGLLFFTDNFLVGITFILIALFINPTTGKLITFRFKTKKARVISIVILFVILYWVFGNYVTEEKAVEKVELSEEGKEILKQAKEISDKKIAEENLRKISLEKYTACDFLPNEEDIPTEFFINEPNEVNNTCSQGYNQGSAFTTRFSIKTYKFDVKEDATETYNELIANEKATRGYTELTSTETCFAIQRAGFTPKIIYYCNWGHIIFKETIFDIGLFEPEILLKKVPQAVRDKVEEARLD